MPLLQVRGIFNYLFGSMGLKRQNTKSSNVLIVIRLTFFPAGDRIFFFFHWENSGYIIF
jgi:hypothetical protein